MDLSTRRVQDLCRSVWHPKGMAELRDPPTGKGKATWWIRRSVNARLLCPQQDPSLAKLAEFPEHIQKLALLKAEIVRQFEVACRSEKYLRWTLADIEKVFCQSVQQEHPHLKISARTLQGWRRRFKERGLLGLVDGRGRGRKDQDPAVATATRSPEAIAFFYQIYRVESRPTVAECHALTLVEARQQGWQWPHSETSTRAWLARHDDRSITYLMRYGYDRWRHKYSPHIVQDYSRLLPGDMFVADHHRLDFHVRYQKHLIRPWLTAVMDVRSRLIVGWHIGPAPHSDAILAALRKAFLDWGIPKAIKLDNGKDYSAQIFHGATRKQIRKFRDEYGEGWKEALRQERDRTAMEKGGLWEGIFGELNIEVKFALPYEPQSKSIERFFRSVNERFSRFEATYCGRSVDTKPEGHGLAIAKGAPSLEEAVQRFSTWLESDYQDRLHKGDGMNGRSPLAVWQQEAPTIHKAETEALTMLMQVRGKYKIGGNGVSLKIGGQTLSYGQYTPEVTRRKGREVLVAIDQQDLSRVAIFTADNPQRREFICHAPSNQRLSPNATQEEVREAMAQRNKALKHAKAAKQSTVARSRTVAGLVADRRRERATANGTDGKPALSRASITPVQTGFEGALSEAKRWRMAGDFSGTKAKSKEAREVDSSDLIRLSDCETHPRPDEESVRVPLLSEQYEPDLPAPLYVLPEFPDRDEPYFFGYTLPDPPKDDEDD